jgi:hypothetical protein
MPDGQTTEPEQTTQSPSPASSALAMIEASAPGIREILSSVINVSGSGRYYEPACAFCSSRNRDDAERLVESFDIAVKQHDAESRVSSFFTSVGENVGVDVIRNHVTSHMNRGDIEIRKMEYVSRLATLTGAQITTLSQTMIARAAVMECIGSIGAITPTRGLSPAKAVELKASVVTKLLKAWVDLIAIQAKLNGEMWDEGKMVAIPTSDFHRVFDDALNAARTPDERKLIVKVLDGLTNATQR